MELLEYWYIIRKRLWIIVLLAIVGTGSAFFFSQRQEPQYRTTTTLYLNPAAPSALLQPVSGRSAESLAKTYSEFMRTQSFAQLMAQEMDSPPSTDAILQAISTQYVADTQFFKITAVYSDPETAQVLANVAAETLIAENMARQRAQQEQIQAQQDPKAALGRERLTELQSALQSELDAYDEQIETISSQIENLQSGPSTEETNQRVLSLREELIRLRSLRTQVLTSLAETQASIASNEESANVDTAVVVDEAQLPAKPLPRDIAQNVLLALAASLVIGGGIAFALEYLDYTIKRPEILDAVYGMPAYGVIDIVGGSGVELDKETALITQDDPFSPTAEAFRVLRTNIQVAGLDEPVRSLLVTSAGPREGKTFIASNIAASMAQNGNRVIAVDADLRKPMLHRAFGLTREPGFTNLVLDEGFHLDDMLKPTEIENLWLLPCGTIPSNPAELLGSVRAAQVMQQLEANADVVVYDTPPAATVTDAVVISPRVDGVLQVIQAGETRIDIVLRCKDVLERAGATVLGPVLNQVKQADVGYYAYYYGYGYYRNGDEPEERQSLLPWRERSTNATAPSTESVEG